MLSQSTTMYFISIDIYHNSLHRKLYAKGICDFLKACKHDFGGIHTIGSDKFQW